MRFSFFLLLAAGCGLVSGSTSLFEAHPGAALGGGYVVPDSSKPLCPDLVSVTPQCSAPAAQAQAVCARDVNCGGVTCNQARSDCQLRYYPLTDLDPSWTGFNSYIKLSPPAPPTYFFDSHPSNAITGEFQVPEASKSLCPDLVSVTPQCSAPLAQAKQVCAQDPNCGGITCNSGRSDCQLRYYPLTALDPSWTGFNSYLKLSYNVYPDYALYGSYQVPAGYSTSICPDLNSVTPQCTVPDSDVGLSICEKDPNCVGLTCNQARGDCQVRYYPITSGESRQGFITKTKRNILF